MNITTEKSTISHQTIKTQRTAYNSPELKFFGSISVLTKGQAGTKCDGVNSGSNNPKTDGVCKSDRAVKQNLVRIGTHPLGIGLYLFDYKPEFRDACGHDRQFGVMADEVETVMPEAVSVHPDGYKQVDYAMLGINNRAH
jgi:hypothetical protein